MLLQHPHLADHHAAVSGLAHVVDGEQGDLHGAQGFHFDAGGAHGFHGGGALNSSGFQLEGHGHAGDGQGVAQGNQVAGFFGGLNAGDAGDAQHVAFFGSALGDQRLGAGQHADAAGGHGHPVGMGLGGHVDHVGLALGVKMGQGAGVGRGHGLVLRGMGDDGKERDEKFTNPLHGLGIIKRPHRIPGQTQQTLLAPHLLMNHMPRFKPFRPPALKNIAQAAILFIAISLGNPAYSQSTLPTLGDTSEMTAGAERRLGDRIARELYRDPDYIDDPVLVEYVQSIWQPLLAAARARGEISDELHERFAFEVFLGKDRSVNAFALPGGYFGLHLGLLAVVSSRDELAAVLAHELSHVTQRHIARLITQEKRQTPWLIGAMILGALAASKNAEVGNAVIAGSQAVAAQGQLNFSRDMEREADRVGFVIAGQAGFDPQGFVGMFDKLQQASRLNDRGAFPYLRSHPLTSERMADMQSRQPPGSKAVPAVNSAQPAMLTARAQVLSNPGVDALRARVDLVSKSTSTSLATQAGVLYGAALASLRLRDVAGANRFAQQLQKWVDQPALPDASAQRLTGLLQAEIALAQGQPERALQRLPEPAAITSRPELLLAAQAGVVTGRQTEVAQALQSWVAGHPRDGGAWQLLATAYTAGSKAQRALRAEAEAQVAWLDYAAANDRLKAAQEMGRRLLRDDPARHDHIEASIIDTRARQVELLLREQALER